MPDSYAGGLGPTAADNLKRFASEGGTLIFLNHSTEYALDALGIAARNVVQGVPNRDFYAPGSLLASTLDTRSPLAYGVPADITIWSEGSPAWELKDGSNARIVASYPKSNVLASGWLLGGKYLEGRASLLDVPLGQGRVILFGMRPQYRAQSYQNFKLLFNALVLANENH
jgi:HAMP domain-containing protein